MTVYKVIAEKSFDGIASINNIKGFVPGLHSATCRLSEILRRAGISHAIVGGVAVSCHGYERVTSNLDAAVGKGAFESSDGATYLRHGLPINVSGIPIHYVHPTSAFEQAMLDQYMIIPAPGQVPIVPIGPLFVLKMIVHRLKDMADLAELVKRNTHQIAMIRSFVYENLPSQKHQFDDLVACAESEMANQGSV